MHWRRPFNAAVNAARAPATTEPTGLRAGWDATIKTLETLNLLTKPITVDEVAIFN